MAGPAEGGRHHADPANDDSGLTLADAARRLGVHYMTAYRYVRLGRLPATQRDGRWRVDPEGLAHLGAAAPSGRGTGPARWAGARQRLRDRLVAGDSGGSWTILEQALARGTSVIDVYLELLGPALRQIGAEWAEGTVSVQTEHRATAVAMRLAGRLAPHLARRGTPVAGTVVVGGAPGDPHVLPVVMLADVLRHHRIQVLDLGANVPRVSFLEVAAAVPDLRAVGVSLSDSGRSPAAATVLAAVRRARPDVVLLAGGPALAERQAALDLGADDWAPDARGAVALLLGGRR